MSAAVPPTWAMSAGVVRDNFSTGAPPKPIFGVNNLALRRSNRSRYPDSDWRHFFEVKSSAAFAFSVLSPRDAQEKNGRPQFISSESAKHITLRLIPTA